MINIQALGGRGTGVNPEGSDYPFVNPQSDLRGLLADAFLAHEVRTAKLPLRISWIRGLGEALGSAYDSQSSSSTATSVDHDVDLIIKDADNVVIFDSRDADSYRQNNFGTRLRVHEWINNDTAVCRVVQHTHFEDDEDVYSIPYIITPQNGILDERVSQQLPQRVTSFAVNLTTMRENVKLTNGYNTRLTPGDDVQPEPRQGVPSPRSPRGPARQAALVLRPKQKITLSANAGSGLGAFPGCDSTDLNIERINAVGPDADGDFLLRGDDCYYVRQPAVLLGNNKSRVTPSTLKIGNDCGPCCECFEFANTYKGVRQLWEKFNTLGERIEAVRDVYKNNLARWVKSKKCREATPLRLASAITVTKGDKTNPLYVNVSGAICNTTDECILDVDLRLCFKWICLDSSSSLSSSESSESSASNSSSSSSSAAESSSCAAMPSPDSYSSILIKPDEEPNECNTTITSSRHTTRQTYDPVGEGGSGWPCYTFHWDDVDTGRSVDFKTRLTWDNCNVQLGNCNYLEITLHGTIGGCVVTHVPVTQHVVDCESCNDGADADATESLGSEADD